VCTPSFPRIQTLSKKKEVLSHTLKKEKGFSANNSFQIGMREDSRGQELYSLYCSNLLEIFGLFCVFQLVV